MKFTINSKEFINVLERSLLKGREYVYYHYRRYRCGYRCRAGYWLRWSAAFLNSFLYFSQDNARQPKTKKAVELRA